MYRWEKKSQVKGAKKVLEKWVKFLWKQQEESLIKITGIQHCRVFEKNEDFAIGYHW